MHQILLLRESIKSNILHKKELIDNFLSIANDERDIAFIKSISSLSASSIIIMIGLYADDMYEFTVRDIINEGSYKIFEFNNKTYSYIGTSKGDYVFSDYNGIIENPPFTLDSFVKRKF